MVTVRPHGWLTTALVMGNRIGPGQDITTHALWCSSSNGRTTVCGTVNSGSIPLEHPIMLGFRLTSDEELLTYCMPYVVFLFGSPEHD